MKKVVAGKTILLNTISNTTFLADAVDEAVQTGTRGNDEHIEWAGELSIPINMLFLEAGPDLLAACVKQKALMDEAGLIDKDLDAAILKATKK